jgi:hypothetical protein
MIEKNKSCENQPPIFPDISLCDIDIDFELNDGKGAWVIVLRKDGRSPQSRADSDGNM